MSPFYVFFSSFPSLSSSSPVAAGVLPILMPLPLSIPTYSLPSPPFPYPSRRLPGSPFSAINSLIYRHFRGGFRTLIYGGSRCK